MRAVGQRRGVLKDLVGDQLRPYLVAMVMNRLRSCWSKLGADGGEEREHEDAEVRGVIRGHASA